MTRRLCLLAVVLGALGCGSPPPPVAAPRVKVVPVSLAVQKITTRQCTFVDTAAFLSPLLALQSADSRGANLFVLFAGSREVSTVNGVVTHDALSTVRGVSYDCPDAALEGVLEVSEVSP